MYMLEHSQELSLGNSDFRGTTYNICMFIVLLFISESLDRHCDRPGYGGLPLEKGRAGDDYRKSILAPLCRRKSIQRSDVGEMAPWCYILSVQSLHTTHQP
jgi:hypothetical protein